MTLGTPRPRHVVVVADDADLREVLASLVEELGHRATAWPSCPDPSWLEGVGAEGLVIDLAFEDRGAAGIGLLQAMRSGNGTRPIPVIASIDAIDGGIDPQALTAFGNVAVVPKPFGIDEFEHALRQSLDGFIGNH